MRVLFLRSIRRLLATVLGMAVILAALAGVMTYGREYRSVKADRSNALQVVKPVAEPLNLAASDFFTDYRLERDKLRSERSDLLREMLRTAKTEEARQRAQDAMLRLIHEKQRETEMENLIKARGFADSLVFVRENTVSAVVKAQTITKEEVLQVADVISRVSGARPEDIAISAKP